MCSMIGVSTTGAMGLGISPVSGKSLVPLPAASAIAFTISLPFSALVLLRLLLEGGLEIHTRHIREVQQVPQDVVDLHPEVLAHGGGFFCAQRTHVCLSVPGEPQYLASNLPDLAREVGEPLLQ